MATKQLIYAFGLRRSGNHGVLNWIFHQRGTPRQFFSNCKLYNPVKRVRKNACNLTIMGFEDCELEFDSHKFAGNEDEFTGPDTIKNSVIVLRDPFNTFASRLKNRIIRKYTLPKLSYYIDLWKKYAHEYLGHTSNLPDLIPINFNLWFESKDYRMSLSKSLGLEFNDDGLNILSRKGVRSSFDGIKFDTRAQEMQVLNRWQQIPSLQKHLNILKDDEIISLTREIFGDIEPIKSTASKIISTKNPAKSIGPNDVQIIHVDLKEPIMGKTTQPNTKITPIAETAEITPIAETELVDPVDGIRMFNAESLTETFTDYKHIVVIGNGKIPNRGLKILEKKIKNADIVIRCNDWNRRKSYSATKGGRRCDLLITHSDSVPIQGKKDFDTPKAVVIAIPAPFHSDRIIEHVNTVYSSSNIYMVNPYTNKLMCDTLKLNSTGCGHPIGTVGFTILYHLWRISRVLPDLDIFVAGYNWRYKPQNQTFDEIPMNSDRRRGNHAYIREVKWIYENLKDHKNFSFSMNINGLFNKYKSAHRFTADYNDLDFINKMIASDERFAFSRFGEGEYSIIDRQEQRRRFWSYTGDSIDRAFSTELDEALKYEHPKYYVGIVSRRPLRFDRGNILSSTMLVDCNYKDFIATTIPLLATKENVFVIGSDCDIQGATFNCDANNMPFKPEKVFTIKQPTSWRHNPDELLNDLIEYLQTTSGKVVSFCVGALSCVLIKKIWEMMPEKHTLIDVGSAFDPYLFGRGTRVYHSKTKVFDAIGKKPKSPLPPRGSGPLEGDTPNVLQCVIPKIIHFIWMGNKNKNVLYNIDKYRELNPDYEIRVHDEFIYADWYDHVKRERLQKCQLADLMRVHLLDTHGGWYLDCDMYPFVGLDHIINTYGIYDFFISKQKDGRINNGIMASIPNHSLWNEYKKNIAAVPSIRTEYGPSKFSDSQDFMNVACDDFSMFYPVDLRNSALNIFKCIVENDTEKLNGHFTNLAKRLKNRKPFMLHTWGGYLDDKFFT